MRIVSKFGYVLAVIGIAGSSLGQELLLNGDFNSSPFTSNWTAPTPAGTSLPTLAGAELVGSTGNSLSLTAGQGAQQNFGVLSSATDGIYSIGTIAFYIRFSNFGTDGSRIRLRSNPGAAGEDILTMRVSSGGQLQRFSGGAWASFATVPTLALNTTYRFGFDFFKMNEGAGRNYSVKWSAGTSAAQSGYLETDLGSITNQTAFHSAPVNTPIERIVFESNAGSGAAFRVDNVMAVPEPATMAALGLGVAGLLRRRKNL